MRIDVAVIERTVRITWNLAKKVVGKDVATQLRRAEVRLAEAREELSALGATQDRDAIALRENEERLADLHTEKRHLEDVIRDQRIQMTSTKDRVRKAQLRVEESEATLVKAQKEEAKLQRGRH